MEYLVFWGCVVFALIAAVFRQIVLEKRRCREFEQKLRQNYGELRQRDYGAERFERMDRYFRKHPEKDQLDDITWNDLGMDEIFKSVNHTYSALGEEYLYYTLRSIGHSLEETDRLEERIRYFSEHEEQRVSLQLQMSKLGYTGNYSLYDYLDHLDVLGERSNRKEYIGDALLIPFVLLLPFQLPIALCGIAAVLIRNILSYFKQKREIEPYVISFLYIIKLMKICENLEKIEVGDCEIIREDFEEMSRQRKKLQAISRGAFMLLSGGGGMGGNPLEILMDYVCMAFHVDLIQFNRMLGILRKNADAVDGMATIVGRLETAVAVGGVRRGMEKKNGWCLPKLSERGDGDAKARFRMSEGYHPLLTEPVKNSIFADRGVLLTGSNASGKSTFLKTCAVNAVLAQTIHTCAAGEYEASAFRVYSSMALRDDLSGGDSYYIVEIKALKRILTASDGQGRPVLCFVDEVLRGTNTVERIAASTQILKSLHRDDVICFAATHDIELTELLAEEYENYHFEEIIAEGDISFPYRLISGKANSRNAIKLLDILGYQPKIIERAEQMAQEFLQNGVWSCG